MVLKSDLKVEGPDMKIDPNSAYGPRNVDFRRRNPQGWDLTRWKYQQYMKGYLRCIKAVDDSDNAPAQSPRSATRQSPRKNRKKTQ
mgnify:CR=1 FL=1